MLKKRLIPVLYLKNGLIVRSENFSDFRELGNPINQLERLNDWNADELIYVDITRSGDYNLKRDDHKIKNQSEIIEILKSISKVCFMPLTFGGRITTLAEVDELIKNGADKVIINSGVYQNPELIKQVAAKYGSQAMVVGVDVKTEGDKHEMYINNGQTKVPDDPIAYVQKVAALGAGEIFLNNIDRDGKANGYDLKLLDSCARAVKIPVIAAGGAGVFEDFVEAFNATPVAALAAGNIFNFTENAYLRAKKKLKEKQIYVR